MIALVRSIVVAAALAALVSGCCADAGECPQNTVAVHVTDGAEPVAGVSVEGGGATWSCAALETVTLCTPASIADGAYVVTVRADGRPDREVTLDVRTYALPPYSCDCEIPTGDVAIDYAPSDPAVDAGA